MSKEAAAAEAAEFAALLDELGGEAEAATAEAPEVEGDEPDAAEGDESTEPEAPADDKPEPLDAEPSAAGKLIEAGDLEGAAKALGIDPKLFKLDKRQFAAMRRGLADAKKKEAEAVKAKTYAERVKGDAERTYGPIAAGFAARVAGDGAKLRAAIELMAEAPFEEIVALVQKAGKPLDAGTAEVMRLRRELAERDQKAQQQTQAQAQAAQAQAEVQSIEKRLSDTPLAKVPGAAKEIHDLVKASWDGVGYSLTVKEAYAKVKAEKAKIAEALTGKPLAVSKGQKREAAEKKPLVPIRKDMSKLSPAERKAAKAEQEKAEFRAVLAEAEAAVQAEIRRGRRAGR
jgi:hypothetical protein